MKILRIRDSKYITKEELAKDLKDKGQRIDFTDVECIAVDIENKFDTFYYLLDSNGNYAKIDKINYKIIIEK